MPSRRSNLIKDPVRYKTVMCEKWAASGTCCYGHKCQFAHGAEELRERNDEKPRKEQKTKRGRVGSADETKRLDSASPAAAAPAALTVDVSSEPSSPASTSPIRTPPAPEQPAVLPLLPPGLGARRMVKFASRDLVVAQSLPSPSTPPGLRPLGELVCGVCEPAPCKPALSRSDSGFQPKVGINSVTGKIELTRLTVSRQPSHTTVSVRRQLSLLFADDLDENEPPPTSSSIWQHDHFGLPAAAA